MEKRRDFQLNRYPTEFINKLRVLLVNPSFYDKLVTELRVSAIMLANEDFQVGIRSIKELEELIVQLGVKVDSPIHEMI